MKITSLVVTLRGCVSYHIMKKRLLNTLWQTIGNSIMSTFMASKFSRLVHLEFVILAFVFSSISLANECPNIPQKVVGTVYCDNQFTLWVNGNKIVTDPIAFTPHQAVKVAFDWDGTSSIIYAIQCEDYASDSGYEYIKTSRPKLGDGALIAKFNDGLTTHTSADWRVYTVTYGPTDASLAKGCSGSNLGKCEVENRGIPKGWTLPSFDDSKWQHATPYSNAEAGWGRPPTWSETKGCCTLTSPNDRSSLGCDMSVTENECLVPRSEFLNTSAGFIWAKDLDRDNRVLFRYTASCKSS